MYDKEGWNHDPYFEYGESFYSLTGNFDVTFTTDSHEIVVATGTETGKPTIRNGNETRHFKAHHVRDFAMELDSKYKEKSTKVDGIGIHVYYDKKYASYAPGMLKSAKKSVQFFNKKFGKYPWPELDIVTMQAWFGGMEYPQFVMISFIKGQHLSQKWINYALVHEIGHQWFYGMVGDNEHDDPWLDESFAEFAANMYSASLQPHGIEEWSPQPPQHAYYHLTSPVTTFIKHGKYGETTAYAKTIYAYGASTLNDLRLQLGDKQFYKSMREYVKKEKFGVAATADFIRIMEKTSGRDLSSFFKEHRVYLKDDQ